MASWTKETDKMNQGGGQHLENTEYQKISEIGQKYKVSDLRYRLPLVSCTSETNRMSQDGGLSYTKKTDNKYICGISIITSKLSDVNY